MEADLRSSAAIVEMPSVSGVSWAAIAAGAGATAALTLLLVAFGAGLGLSAVSPWSDSGVSSTTLSVGTGIYLIVVAVMSSAIGGYLAGRLRTKWVGIHSNEVFFRDSAHGFLAWAVATLISATALASTTAYLANDAVAGIAGGSAQAVQSINPSQIYVDKLFRPAPAATAAQTSAPAPAATNNDQAAAPAAAETANPLPPAEAPGNQANSGRARAEILRLWTADFRNGEDLGADDRAYVAQVVAAQTGMTEADARKRVDQVVIDAKTAADKARRGAAHLSFWLTAALLFGAFAASLAAVEGGALRDGTWNDRVLTPRAI
jgi:hypothetical protein